MLALPAYLAMLRYVCPHFGGGASVMREDTRAEKVAAIARAPVVLAVAVQKNNVKFVMRD